MAESIENVLEQALLDDPDDLAAHSAYADWLCEQGDPRGELIQIQLALEEPEREVAERKELQQREQVLLQAHAREWLGALAPYLVNQQGVDENAFRSQGRYEFQFARGWLDSIRVPELSIAFARALVRFPRGTPAATRGLAGAGLRGLRIRAG